MAQVESALRNLDLWLGNHTSTSSVDDLVHLVHLVTVYWRKEAPQFVSIKDLRNIGLAAKLIAEYALKPHIPNALNRKIGSFLSDINLRTRSFTNAEIFQALEALIQIHEKVPFSAAMWACIFSVLHLNFPYRVSNPFHLTISPQIHKWRSDLYREVPLQTVLPGLMLLVSAEQEERTGIVFEKYFYQCFVEFDNTLEVFLSQFVSDKDEGMRESTPELCDRFSSVLLSGGKFIEKNKYFQCLIRQSVSLLSFESLPSNRQFPLFILSQFFVFLCRKFPQMFLRAILSPILSFDLCGVPESISCLYNLLNSVSFLESVQENSEIRNHLIRKGFWNLVMACTFAEEAKIRQRKALMGVLESMIRLDESNFEIILECFIKERTCSQWIAGDDGQLAQKSGEVHRNSVIEAQILSEAISKARGNLELLNFVLLCSNIVVKLSDPADISTCMLLLERSEEAIFTNDSLSVNLAAALGLIARFLKATNADSSRSLAVGMLTSILYKTMLEETHLEILKTDIFPVLSTLTNDSDRDIAASARVTLQTFGLYQPQKKCMDAQLNKLISALSDADDASRSFALKQITELLLTKSFSNIDVHKCLEKLEEQIHDPESIVAILAIKALARLSKLYPEISLPMLISRYRSLSLPEPSRVKIAEAMAQLIRDMGISLFEHRNSLIRALLDGGVQNGNPVIRKSAFSCLADCIEAIAYGSFEHITEICEAILWSLTAIESCWEVKQASIYLSAVMINKIGKVMLERNPEAITSLYEGLQRFEAKISSDESTLKHNTETAILQVRESLVSLLSDGLGDIRLQ